MAISDYGIVSIETALTTKFSKRKKVEPGTPVLSNGGTFVTNVAKGLSWDISAEGAGDLPADFTVGGAGPTIDGLSGGSTIIEEADETQTNDGEPNRWTAKGVHAPAVT